MRKNAGFTVVEIMVVLSVMAILVTGIIFSVSEAQQQSRDALRKSDLQTLKSALDLYKQKYGRYPEGCNGADNWSGEPGTSFACPGGSAEYILNDINDASLGAINGVVENFSPQFMRTLPRDPKLNGVNSGYAYVTNAYGTSFKVVAFNTVEADLQQNDEGFPFSRCGDITNPNWDCGSSPTAPSGGTYAPPGECNNATAIEDDYAVYGGFHTEGSDQRREYYRESVICK